MSGNCWYQGRRHRESSGSTRESDARRLLKQRIAELHSGTFVRPRDQRLIVSHLLDALQEDYELRGGKNLSPNSSPICVRSERPWVTSVRLI